MLPTLFIGHGSPTNALEHNVFTSTWIEEISSIPKPQAILIISAHWQTEGTFITGSAQPETIHDFEGFPQELFEIKYPVVGNPLLANSIAEKLGIEVDALRGLDHGVWSILVHAYPQADIPVLQMSLDINKTVQEHFEFAQQLAYLREQGVLIIGSGNIVHNLALADWSNTQINIWAQDFNKHMIRAIEEKKFQDIINYTQYAEISRLSVPSNEHFLPLLYTCGVTHKEDVVEIFNNQIIMGTIGMTCVKFA
jgi:4,5-DOPA dioxygenase extradiol